MKAQNKNLISVVFIALIAYLSIAYFIYYQDKNLFKNSRYTISISIKNTYGRGNSGVKYKYFVNGIEYFAWDATNKKSIENNRYFIIYNKEKPHQSTFFVDCPVPDSIKNFPKNGWEKIPIPNYQSYVDDYFKTNFQRLKESICK